MKLPGILSEDDGGEDEDEDEPMAGEFIKNLVGAGFVVRERPIGNYDHDVTWGQNHSHVGFDVYDSSVDVEAVEAFPTGSGVGKAMMSAFIAAAKASGVSDMSGSIWHDDDARVNRKLDNFYRSVGFTVEHGSFYLKF